MPFQMDYSKVPAHHMVEGVRRWIEDGRCGDFLRAVVSNDLFQACGRADDINRPLLPEWVRFFYNHAPGDCWGSKEKMEAWAAARQSD